MTYSATKTFEVTEGSVPGMWYRIEVRFRGELVHTFERPTMDAAIRAFTAAGYERIMADEDTDTSAVRAARLAKAKVYLERSFP